MCAALFLVGALVAAAALKAPLPAAHVDAFTALPYSGNPACVVLLESAAEPAWMQRVANEMQLSETAFLVPTGGASNDFELRWFTPTDEVDLCGHATLASSHALWEVHECDDQQPLIFHTRSGVLAATRDRDGWISLDFPTCAAVAVPDDSTDWQGVLRAFPSLSEEDVLYIGRNAVGGPGGGDVLLEVPPAAFAALEFDLSAIEKHVVCRVLSVTTAGCPVAPPAGCPSEYDFSSRAFAPSVGAPEDPVCGSAHCMLGPFWQRKLGGKAQLLARAASPRGGDVRVSVNGDRTLLSGQAVTTMKGELLH